MTRIDKWDKWFLGMAEYVSTASKDPSTKVGAVIVRPDRTVASVGYNGFPRGIEDSPERLNHRETKYKYVVHGEMNAIANCKEDMKGFTLYTWPFFTCSVCALHVIQHSIKRVVAHGTPELLRNRWDDSLNIAREIYTEAGVKYEIF